MKVLEFLTFLLTIASGYAWWRNSWDGVLNFRCPQHHGVYGSISRIKSHHHNGKEDRQWDFECNYDIRTQSSCSWPHDFVNGWDAELQYECPKYGYIAGAYSYHDNHREDRRWKYFCCDCPRGYSRSHCYWTSYINSMDGWMDYKLGPGRVIVGLSSYHSNHHEDRRWRLKICSLSQRRSLSLSSNMTETDDFEYFHHSDEDEGYEVENYEMEQEDDEMKYGDEEITDVEDEMQDGENEHKDDNVSMM